MKLASFRRDRTVSAGLVLGRRIIDFSRLPASYRLPSRMRDVIATGEDGLASMRRLAAAARKRGARLPWAEADEVEWLSPVPDPLKLLAVAANYRKHIREAGFRVPDAGPMTPQFFLKPPSTCLVGHGGEVRITSHNVFVDWEVELGVVMGIPGRCIPAGRALDHVYGYTVCNDLSERKQNSQISGRVRRDNDAFFDWLSGKWYDGFCPCGPVLVTKDEIPDPQRLRLRHRVNGKLHQNSNTKHMIHGVAELIAYISSIVTLETGDLLSTGTPEGVGFPKNVRLRPGDVIEGEIAGIGVLRNRITHES